MHGIGPGVPYSKSLLYDDARCLIHNSPGAPLKESLSLGKHEQVQDLGKTARCVRLEFFLLRFDKLGVQVDLNAQTTLESGYHDCGRSPY